MLERLDVLSIADLIHYDVLLANDSMNLVFVLSDRVVVRSKNQDTAVTNDFSLLHRCSVCRVRFVLSDRCIEVFRSLRHTDRVSYLLGWLLALALSHSATT